MEEKSREIKELQEKVHSLEQLAVMGKLILCVAHELNRFLQEIHATLLTIQDRERDLAAKERHLAEALNTVDKMTLTINSLLSCSKSINL